MNEANLAAQATCDLAWAGVRCATCASAQRNTTVGIRNHRELFHGTRRALVSDGAHRAKVVARATSVGRRCLAKLAQNPFLVGKNLRLIALDALLIRENRPLVRQNSPLIREDLSLVCDSSVRHHTLLVARLTPSVSRPRRLCGRPEWYTRQLVALRHLAQ